MNDRHIENVDIFVKMYILRIKSKSLKSHSIDLYLSKYMKSYLLPLYGKFYSIYTQKKINKKNLIKKIGWKKKIKREKKKEKE